MKSSRLHRLIAAAAHLALLFAVCTPVVSRLLMVHEMGGGTAHASAMHDMHHGMDMANGSAMPGHHPDGKAPMDACGYCSFFAHAPIAPVIVPTIAVLPPLPAPKMPTMVAEGVRHVTHASFRPRGPPADFVVS